MPEQMTIEELTALVRCYPIIRDRWCNACDRLMTVFQDGTVLRGSHAADCPRIRFESLYPVNKETDKC